MTVSRSSTKKRNFSTASLEGNNVPKMKSSKICVKNGDDIVYFMWALVGAHGDVMMGFPWQSNDSVVLAMEEEENLTAEQLHTEGFTGHSKITFHNSGHYKLAAKMGKEKEATDRATVIGPKLEEINEPRRMVELLLPEELPGKPYTPTDRDILLDITGVKSKPTRCTIFCMANEHFENFNGKETKIVDTSIFECTHALQTESHAWTWTLRKSKDDELYGDKVYVTLLGDIKWGM